MATLRILAWMFVGSLALVFMGALLSLPVLFYLFGVPWLPSTPRASDTQLWLIALYYPVLGGCALWQGKAIYRWLLSRLQIGSAQAKTSKPQSLYSSRSQAVSGTYQDLVVIGGGREKNEIVLLLLIIIGIGFMFGGSLGFIAGNIVGDPNARIELYLFDTLGLMLILGGIALWLIGRRKECVKIGSEGIAHYSKEKGSVFIPWNEMSNAYVDVHYFYKYLYIVLDDDSSLFYEKPIKLRYEADIGKSGAVMICQVSNSKDALIPEHLVQRALQRYAPPGIL